MLVLPLILLLPEFLCSLPDDFYGKPKLRKKREIDALDVGQLDVDDSDPDNLKFKFHIAVDLNKLREPNNGEVVLLNY